MQGEEDRRERPRTGDRRHFWRRPWFMVLGIVVALSCLALVVAGEYVVRNAEPILRKRIVETLSARFHEPVALDRVEISLFKGIEVEGWGLRIPFTPAGGGAAANYPLLTVQHFAFRTTIRSLLRQSTHVPAVRVDGMQLHIPPANQRAGLFGTKGADLNDPDLKGRVAIVVDAMTCRDVQVLLEPGTPGKVPLEFDIARLEMESVGRDQAMRYDAELTIPRPHGLIHATGHFGPWGGVPSSQLRPEVPVDPAETPIDGNYTFDHADLNTIKGIGGTLASTGHFGGALGRLVVDGTADVPDFSLDISNRPLPLHTVFHATVDGLSGDTYLDPVKARLAGSDFLVRGKVVKAGHHGHDISLEVDIPHGRMQDFLRLAVKTNPPLMNGDLTMKARLQIPPGDVRVPDKMSMEGSFQLGAVRFNNSRMQDRIDGLSARAQGLPEQVTTASRDREAEVHSTLAANFVIGHGVMQVSEVRYAIPGALVLLNGVYSMDGRLFEFKGHVRTQATASQMVGGWKGLLLTPFDKLLEKNGAGVELPVEISGTEGDLHLGLALHGTDQSPTQMLDEVRGNDRARREMEAARQEAAQADAEDAAAAKAGTLAAAQQAHAAAVRHRAAARSLAADAQQLSGRSQ